MAMADKIQSNSVNLKGVTSEQLVPWSIKKPEKKVPTPEELKAIGTEEAYNKGVELGYWQ